PARHRQVTLASHPSDLAPTIANNSLGGNAMNEHEPLHDVDDRLQGYFSRLDRTTRPLTPSNTWAKVAARLATPDVRGTASTMHDIASSSRNNRAASIVIDRRSPPHRMLPAIAAVVLLALLSASVFALAHHQPHPATTTTPLVPTCQPAQIKADLPRGA